MMIEGRQHHLRLERCLASQQGEASSLEAPAIVAVASSQRHLQLENNVAGFAPVCPVL